MQEGVFKRDDAGRLYLVKEAKPAWLAVLQGLKGTAKAQNALRSRIGLFSQDAAKGLTLPIDKGSTGAHWLRDFRTYLRGEQGLGAITRNAKGERVSSTLQGISPELGRLRGGFHDEFLGSVYNQRRIDGALRRHLGLPIQPAGKPPVVKSLDGVAAPDKLQAGYDSVSHRIQFDPKMNELAAAREYNVPLSRFLRPKTYNQSVLQHETGHGRQLTELPMGDLSRETRYAQAALNTALRGRTPAWWQRLFGARTVQPAQFPSAWNVPSDGAASRVYLDRRAWVNPLAGMEGVAPENARAVALVEGFNNASAARTNALLRRVMGGYHRQFAWPRRNTLFNSGVAGRNQIEYNYKLPLDPRRPLP